MKGKEETWGKLQDMGEERHSVASQTRRGAKTSLKYPPVDHGQLLD
jgi:hypothetical protein